MAVRREPVVLGLTTSFIFSRLEVPPPCIHDLFIKDSSMTACACKQNEGFLPVRRSLSKFAPAMRSAMKPLLCSDSAVRWDTALTKASSSDEASLSN
jgi:hypothetical protein